MEDRRAFLERRGGELQVHLEKTVGAAAGVHLDPDIHLRRAGAQVQGIRRMRVFEAEVADELGQDADPRRAGLGFAVAGLQIGAPLLDIAHVLVSRLKACPGSRAPGKARP